MNLSNHYEALYFHKKILIFDIPVQSHAKDLGNNVDSLEGDLPYQVPLTELNYLAHIT